MKITSVICLYILTCIFVTGTAIQESKHSNQLLEEALTSIRRLKKQKSMTTKSTMTNEDDYTVAAHTNTPRTTPSASTIDEDLLHDVGNDAIAVGHKIVGWKITPRVSIYLVKFLTTSIKRTNPALMCNFGWLKTCEILYIVITFLTTFTV